MNKLVLIFFLTVITLPITAQVKKQKKTSEFIAKNINFKKMLTT